MRWYQSLTLIVAMALLGLGLSVASTAPADAVIGFAKITNLSQRTIKVACSYGGSLISLSPGQTSIQPGKCTKSRSDVDQFVVPTTSIMIYAGPKRTDGCYRVQPNVRMKVPDLSLTNIYNLSRGCGSKRYLGYWSMR